MTVPDHTPMRRTPARHAPGRRLAVAATALALGGSLLGVAPGQPTATSGPGASTVAPTAGQAPAETDERSLGRLRDLLGRAQTRGLAPAFAGVHVRGTDLTSAAVGQRRQGRPARTTAGDRYHVGSLTKAITATALARLVERGDLTWRTTPADVWPQRADSLHPRLRDVTLRQLLVHRSGLAAYTLGTEFVGLPAFTGTPREQRRSFALYLLRRPPEFRPGTFHYGNADYAVAAAMAEHVTGRGWRQLVRRQVFAPIGARVSYGWPADRPQQPYGHVVDPDSGRPVALEPGAYRIPLVVAPAGDVSLRPVDHGRFLRAHLAGLRGRDTALLPAARIRQLHRPVGDYSMGWFEQRVQGARLSLHDGTLGTFTAWTALDRRRGRAATVVANLGGAEAGEQVLATTLRALALRRAGAVAPRLLSSVGPADAVS